MEQQLMNNVLEIATQMLEFHIDTHTYTQTHSERDIHTMIVWRTRAHCNQNRVREFWMLITSSTKTYFSIGNIHLPQSFVRGAQLKHNIDRITKMHYADSIEFFFSSFRFFFCLKSENATFSFWVFFSCSASKTTQMKEKSHTKFQISKLCRRLLLFIWYLSLK